MLSFLTPLYLLAGFAILAPILAHLVRKRPREVMDFSSVIFLDASPPRLTNRNRIEQWLLLALRSLILLALALAFARPYLKTLIEQQTSTYPSKERILLIDTSASMRREGVWEQAIQKAKEYIANSQPEDSIAVVAMTDRIESLHSLEQSRQSGINERKILASKSIDGVTPTWLSCDLGQCMLQAIELLNDSRSDQETKTPAEIAIVSDFQSGNPLDSLGSIQWPQEIPIVPLVCQPKVPGNATISILPRSDDSSTAISQNTERILVRNATRSKKDRFSLKWLDSDGKPLTAESQEVFVPAGQQQILVLERPTLESNGAQSPLVIELDGDDQLFDNRQYLHRGKKQKAKAICLDSKQRDPKDSLWYFAVRVPISQPSLDVQWEIFDPTEELKEADHKDLRLVIASSDLSALWAQKLREPIENGLHVWWILDRPTGTLQGDQAGVDPARLEEIWKTWFPNDAVAISERTIDRFQLLQNIDMSHPMFSAFSDPKFNDFTKIRFWKHRQVQGLLSNDWRILANYDDGTPAIFQRPLGKGMVSVLASGWQPIESQLALSSKFVPIVVAMFEQASPLQPDPDYRCGERIPSQLAHENWQSIVQQQSYDVGKELGLKDPQNDGVFIAPGIFKASNQEEFVAVNLSKSEGLTDPIDLEEFARFGIPIGQPSSPSNHPESVSRKNQLAEQMEASQSGWWWILLAVLIFAGLESLIAAWRTGHWASVSKNNR
jgi:hypothetical protein